MDSRLRRDRRPVGSLLSRRAGAAHRTRRGGPGRGQRDPVRGPRRPRHGVRPLHGSRHAIGRRHLLESRARGRPWDRRGVPGEPVALTSRDRDRAGLAPFREPGRPERGKPRQECRRLVRGRHHLPLGERPRPRERRQGRGADDVHGRARRRRHVPLHGHAPQSRGRIVHALFLFGQPLHQHPGLREHAHHPLVLRRGLVREQPHESQLRAGERRGNAALRQPRHRRTAPAPQPVAAGRLGVRGVGLLHAIRRHADHRDPPSRRRPEEGEPGDSGRLRFHGRPARQFHRRRLEFHRDGRHRARQQRLGNLHRPGAAGERIPLPGRPLWRPFELYGDARRSPRLLLALRPGLPIHRAMAQRVRAQLHGALVESERVGMGHQREPPGRYPLRHALHL